MAHNGSSDAKQHRKSAQQIRRANERLDALAGVQETLVDITAQNTTDIRDLKLAVAKMQQKV